MHIIASSKILCMQILHQIYSPSYNSTLCRMQLQPMRVMRAGESIGDQEDTKAKEDRSGSSRPKRNYFWCPVVDCASGPVQKVTQHLQKVHKMDAATATKVAKKKRRAPPEAVRLKLPNPKTHSSGLQDLGLFTKRMAPHSASTTSHGQSSAPPKDTPGPSTPSSTKPTVPPCTPSTLAQAGNVHLSGLFLDGFYSHLRTRAGGNRGEHSAKQITRYVGKYHVCDMLHQTFGIN